MERQFICIECPRGCTLTVTGTGDAARVTGNFCPRGAAYGKAEATQPRRVITSTVRSRYGMIPVKTDGAVRKELIFDIMKKIRAFRTDEHISAGDVLILDIDGEGISLVATGDAPAADDL